MCWVISRAAAVVQLRLSGCGKSTLMMVLFRMVEPSGGAVLIDGLETSKIGLTDLRSRLSLVPQDPVIFSGTVRSNLDPFGQAGSDAAIWEALRQAGIQDLVKALGVSVVIQYHVLMTAQSGLQPT